MRKNMKRNIIAAILFSTVIANTAFAGATGRSAIDFTQLSEGPAPSASPTDNAAETNTANSAETETDTALSQEYVNPTGNTGWFKFGTNWFYYNNGIAIRDGLSPDGYALDINGVYVPSNIDHAKYAAESLLGKQILVFSKSAMRVELWTNGVMTGTWTATSGRNHGDKNVEGDCKTPEGRFYLAQKLPNSNYTRGLLVSYPNVEDAERGLAQGLISNSTYRQIVAANAAGITPPQNTALGGMIEFHGNGQPVNATHGCIGLKNQDIIQLYNLVQAGAVIDILP